MISLFVPLSSLLLVLDDILFLQLPHPLDFVEVYHKALVIRMELFDAFSAEYCQMVGTVEVLDSFLMVFTELVLQRVFVFLIKVKVSFRKNRVLLDYLI